MNDPIAVVGMACRYPDADTVQDLVENSLAQRRAFRAIPARRLHPDLFDDSGRDADRAYARPARLLHRDYGVVSGPAADGEFPRQAALINGFEFDRQWFRVPRSSFDV